MRGVAEALTAGASWWLYPPKMPPWGDEGNTLKQGAEQQATRARDRMGQGGTSQAAAAGLASMLDPVTPRPGGPCEADESVPKMPPSMELAL